MSRWVTPKTTGMVGATAAQAPDGPIDRIVKYIPGEVVSAFTILFSALVAMNLAGPTSRWAAIALIVLFLLATLYYVATRTPAGPVRNAHLVVTPLAFLAWAYPISSSLLGGWFIGLVSFFLQAIVIALSIFIVPTVTGPPPAAVQTPAGPPAGA